MSGLVTLRVSIVVNPLSCLQYAIAQTLTLI